LVKCELQDLFEDFGYPEEVTQFDSTDIDLCLNCCLWDLETGLILKLGDEKKVLRAYKGFEPLSTEDIEGIYGTPPVYENLNYPQQTSLVQGRGHWSFITFFDCPKVGVVAKCMALKAKGLVKKSNYDIAKDLRDIIFKEYVHYNEDKVHGIGDYGHFFPAILKDPTKFIQP